MVPILLVCTKEIGAYSDKLPFLLFLSLLRIGRQDERKVSIRWAHVASYLCLSWRELQRFEMMDEKLRSCGEAIRWSRGADPAARQVRRCMRSDLNHALLHRLCQAAGHVNGSLSKRLAKLIGYHDPDCIEMFREGCSIMGDLPYADVAFCPQPNGRSAELVTSCTVPRIGVS